MKQGYRIISISRLGVTNGTPTFCEHCGRVIFNFAIIQNRVNNNKSRVGLCCMHTLCESNNPQPKQLSFNF